MDAQLKQKWVEALRSGKYEQARGVLKNDDGAHCCLGVLCEIAGLPISADFDGIAGHISTVAGSLDGYRPIFDLVGGVEAAHSCSMRNDGSEGSFKYHPHSFAEIADYIEANIPADVDAA